MPVPATLTHRAIVLAGPTASGKSEVAVELAALCEGEIVSADAFQIYQGLPLLTAQPEQALLARTPHHLISELPLSSSFDVAQFLELADARLADIRARGKVPILAGGAGLYLRAATAGLAELPQADTALREKLSALPLPELQKQLADLDATGFAQIDRQNPRRLVRALEVCILTGRPFSSFRTEWSEAGSRWSGVLIQRDRTELNDRINRRAERMLATGAIEEVQQTHSCEFSATARQIIGLREIRDHLAGAISLSECLTSIQQATRQYAKRQLTWFKREPNLEAIAVNENESPAETAERIHGRIAAAWPEALAR